MILDRTKVYSHGLVLASDLPLSPAARPIGRLAEVLDIEGKIERALEALGPLGGRDAAFLDVPEVWSSRFEPLTAVRQVPRPAPPAIPLPDGSADVLVSLWAGFRGIDPAEIAEADRVLRDGGRLLVVHDYGRDDVSRLLDADRPEYTTWSRRDGPFLANGFKIRVLHCFWTFADLDELTAYLHDEHGPRGDEVAAGLRRPRLSWKVAVYHRDRGGNGASRS